MSRGTAVLRRGVRGSVSAFDERTGLGEVTSENGTVSPFHATAVADGSRRIDAGIEVVYDVVAGHLGRWEADDLRASSHPLP